MDETLIDVGPVDLVVIRFTGNKFTGEVAPALLDLAQAGTVRILDALFVTRDGDGGGRGARGSRQPADRRVGGRDGTSQRHRPHRGRRGHRHGRVEPGLPAAGAARREARIRAVSATGVRRPVPATGLPAAGTAAATDGPAASVAERPLHALAELTGMRDRGVLTEQEFAAAKAKLLGM